MEEIYLYSVDAPLRLNFVSLRFSENGNFIVHYYFKILNLFIEKSFFYFGIGLLIKKEI